MAQHENTKPLQAKVEDAAAKVRLIQTEIAFNQAVTSSLEELQCLCQQLDAGRVDLREGRIMVAIDTLETLETAMNKDKLFINTNVKQILIENVSGLRKEIAEALRMLWNEQLKIDRGSKSFQVSKDESRCPCNHSDLT